MTSPDGHTLLSVRGQAQRNVAPDQASLYLLLTATSQTKHGAAETAASIQARLTRDLEPHGGQVLTVDSMRAPLTWSTQAMHTFEEHGPHGHTGRQQANLTVVVAIRDFALLPAVESVVTHHDGVELQSVQWSVDSDNPEWASVRADAIHAALAKGQDYASALGGSVTGVIHVADAGLLGGESSAQGEHFAMSSSMRLTSGGTQTASLDPTPQLLTAIIEARLRATVPPLS